MLGCSLPMPRPYTVVKSTYPQRRISYEGWKLILVQIQDLGVIPSPAGLLDAIGPAGLSEWKHRKQPIKSHGDHRRVFWCQTLTSPQDPAISRSMGCLP